MASINTNVGGVDFAVTKQADGSYTISSESMPGSSYGPNNESVAGHWGTTLSPDKIASAINGTQNLIDSDNWNINNKLKQINDPNITDEAYKNTLRTQVAESQAQLEQHQAQLTAITGIQSQISSLTSQVDAADASSAPAGEAKTTAEASADATQSGVSNQEPGQPPASSLEEQTNKELGAAYGLPTTSVDPTQFQGESGNAAPDRPDSNSVDQLNQDNENGDESEDDGGDGYGDTSGGGGGSGSSDINSNRPGINRLTGKPFSSAPTAPASAQWAGTKDMRVWLEVPPDYIGSTASPGIQQRGGISFPYTPSISYDTQASYGSVNPLHSNYTQYFFKNSAVGAITLSCKFTVQSESEGEEWLSVVHLGRALTKMPFGNDPNLLVGSAPPVCRLYGYGNWMFSNVPVAVTSFKFDLPESVDYIQVTKGKFANTMAPTISTITFSFIPMYSRQEIRDFAVTDWLDGKLGGKGYL